MGTTGTKSIMNNEEKVFVLGAGLPRTGTNSLQTALQILLEGPVYHMYEVLKTGTRDVPFWNEACKAEKTPEEWRDFFAANDYLGGVDYPLVLFYKEIMEAFPKSKVVLILRDPEAWYASVNMTIKKLNDDANKFPVNMLLDITGEAPIYEMKQNVLRRDRNRLHQGIFDVMEEGLEASVDYYNNWVEEVKRTVPEDRLLVFRVQEGWEPLCEFLGMPVPNEPFPHVNDKNVIKQMGFKQKMVAWSLAGAAEFYRPGLPKDPHFYGTSIQDIMNNLDI